MMNMEIRGSRIVIAILKKKKQSQRTNTDSEYLKYKDQYCQELARTEATVSPTLPPEG